MTTLATSAPIRRVDLLHPLPAALVGGAVFAVAMTVGDVFDLNSDQGNSSTGWTDIAAYAGLLTVAVALAVWLGIRARTCTPDRLARTSLGLALAAAVTFVAFWSGWPHVLGAVAVVTALEHRRRVGSFGGLTIAAAAIGLLALVASTVVCVIG